MMSFHCTQHALITHIAEKSKNETFFYDKKQTTKRIVLSAIWYKEANSNLIGQPAVRERNKYSLQVFAVEPLNNGHVGTILSITGGVLSSEVTSTIYIIIGK